MVFTKCGAQKSLVENKQSEAGGLDKYAQGSPGLQENKKRRNQFKAMNSTVFLGEIKHNNTREEKVQSLSPKRGRPVPVLLQPFQ